MNEEELKRKCPKCGKLALEEAGCWSIRCGECGYWHNYEDDLE